MMMLQCIIVSVKMLTSEHDCKRRERNIKTILMKTTYIHKFQNSSRISFVSHNWSSTGLKMKLKFQTVCLFFCKTWPINNLCIFQNGTYKIKTKNCEIDFIKLHLQQSNQPKQKFPWKFEKCAKTGCCPESLLKKCTKLLKILMKCKVNEPNVSLIMIGWFLLSVSHFQRSRSQVLVIVITT